MNTSPFDNANGDRTSNQRHRFTKRVVTFSTSDTGEYITQRSETITEYYSSPSNTDGSDFDEMSDVTSGMSSARSDLTFSMDTNLSEDFSEEFSEEENWDAGISPHQAEAMLEMAGVRLEDLEDVQVGAPQMVIDNLPTFYQNSETQGFYSDQKQCLICLEAFRKGDELCILPCTHRYHRSCVHEWLTRNSTCPVCRKNILED